MAEKMPLNIFFKLIKNIKVIDDNYKMMIEGVRNEHIIYDIEIKNKAPPSNMNFLALKSYNKDISL